MWVNFLEFYLRYPQPTAESSGEGGKRLKLIWPEGNCPYQKTEKWTLSLSRPFMCGVKCLKQTIMEFKYYNGSLFWYPNNLGLVNNLCIEAFKPQVGIKTFFFYPFLQAGVIMSLGILIAKGTFFLKLFHRIILLEIQELPWSQKRVGAVTIMHTLSWEPQQLDVSVQRIASQFMGLSIGCRLCIV